MVEQGEGHTANVVTLAESKDAASTLVAALKATGLDEALAAEGPFTVFAPTNDAFTALLAELGTDVTGLLAREDIVDILKYHVVSGKVRNNLDNFAVYLMSTMMRMHEDLTMALHIHRL